MQISRRPTICLQRWDRKAIQTRTCLLSSGCAAKEPMIKCLPSLMLAMPMILAAACSSWVSEK